MSLRTSDGDVFAAGDIANAEHPFYGRRLRVEHWANALHQGPRPSRGRCSASRRAYDRLPYFFSDQYDLGMEFRGLPFGADTFVVRGDAERTSSSRTGGARGACWPP